MQTVLVYIYMLYQTYTYSIHRHLVVVSGEAEVDQVIFSITNSDNVLYGACVSKSLAMNVLFYVILAIVAQTTYRSAARLLIGYDAFSSRSFRTVGRHYAERPS